MRYPHKPKHYEVGPPEPEPKLPLPDWTSGQQPLFCLGCYELQSMCICSDEG